MLKQIAGKSKFRCADRSNVAKGINFAGLTGGDAAREQQAQQTVVGPADNRLPHLRRWRPRERQRSGFGSRTSRRGQQSPWVIPDSEPPAALPPGVYVYARVREGHEQVAPVRDAAGRRQGHSQRDCFGIQSLAAENPLDFPSQAVGESTGTTHSLDDIFATSIGCPPDRARCQASPHRSFEMAWGH